MIFKLTSKNCQISDSSYKHLRAHLNKIIRSLPNVEEDLVVFRLIIRKNIDKYHPPRIHPHTHKSYADSKPLLAHFEGSISFRLDKKPFFVHFKGQTIDECLESGFERIFKKLDKFKDLHFPGQSKYPDRASIRGVSYG